MFNLFKKKEVALYMPTKGKVIELDQVPDQVFASRMVGDGVAFIPHEDLIKAPCSGKVVQVFPTNHAIGIESKEGLEVLIHLGIDTVELKGEGFQRLIEEGQEIKKGDPLAKMNLDLIKEKGKEIITPVVITNMEVVKELKPCRLDETIDDEVILNIRLK